MAGADRLDGADRGEGLGIGLLVDVARELGRSLGERAAGVGGGVQDRYAALAGQRDHRGGVGVDQRVAVVGDEHVEIEVAQNRHHHVDAAGGETDGCGQTLLLHAEELVQRAALAGDLVEIGGVFGIVEVEDLDAVAPQRLEALLEGAAGAGGVEAERVHVAVELGREDPALGPAAHLAHDLADAALAAAVGVIARGVEEAVLHREHGPDGGQRALLGDLVTVGAGHRAEAGGSETERRHAQPGFADFNALRHRFPHVKRLLVARNRGRIGAGRKPRRACPMLADFQEADFIGKKY